jgi:cyclopropane fatty-acyl-phospholipid synthase-like methyltransferase
MGFIIQFLFSYPAIYSTVTCYLRGEHNIQDVVDQYVKPKSGDRIFDVGCGTGDLLKFLPKDIEYYGFDMDSEYIKYAERHFGDRGKFWCEKATRDVINKDDFFDEVVVMGVIHHLNDEDATSITELAYQILKPGGRMVFLMDGCYTPEISLIEKMFLFIDRGAYVRTEGCYKQLITDKFSSIQTYIRHDMFRIPYSTIIVVCIK